MTFSGEAPAVSVQTRNAIPQRKAQAILSDNFFTQSAVSERPEN
jgi:hypothetical protein